MSANIECKGVKLEAPEGIFKPMRLTCVTCGKVIARHGGGLGAAEWIAAAGKMQRDHAAGRSLEWTKKFN